MLRTVFSQFRLSISLFFRFSNKRQKNQMYIRQNYIEVKRSYNMTHITSRTISTRKWTVRVINRSFTMELFYSKAHVFFDYDSSK